MDWLALPGDQEPVTAEKTFEVQPAEKYAADLDEPPPVSEQALVAANKEVIEAQRQFDLSYSLLTKDQRRFLRDLKSAKFNRSLALKLFNRNPSCGVKLTPSVVTRWLRLEAFNHVYTAMRREMVDTVTHRDELLLRAHRAAEYAEKPQPILHQGNATGFFERKPAEMVRANEQLMRATKVIGEQAQLGGGTGPALVIQVVQRDGALIDVTPKGVTIDMPVPSGA